MHILMPNMRGFVEFICQNMNSSSERSKLFIKIVSQAQLVVLTARFIRFLAKICRATKLNVVLKFVGLLDIYTLKTKRAWQM